MRFASRSPLRLAVLISGGGTTLKNLLTEIAAKRLDASIELVLSSNPQAGGLRLASDAGIASRVLRERDHADSAGYGAAVFDTIRRVDPHLVVMAGFLKFTPIPPDFEFRVLNIHPALIPAFCGKGFYGQRVHEAVLEYGAKLSGCTVHFVDNEYDHGPIIHQVAVPVLADDTPATLASRVFQAECQAYPQVLRWFAAGQIEAQGRVVRVWPN